MPILEGERSLMSHSKTTKTLTTSLPVDFIKTHNLGKGDKIKFISNGILVYIPPDVYNNPKFNYANFKRKLFEAFG